MNKRKRKSYSNIMITLIFLLLEEYAILGGVMLYIVLLL